ncbi:unnamed protein product [Brassicogethes aeneus]|uniref:S-adenosylmethionine mitochondrial carrier protein n=1 Tax=Brassicogethes aeneus TaxID=1431903 RepID=A0A9P0BIJ3_BRAAE|nr:unnamed protein product [Brassicogethes aeneus]
MLQADEIDSKKLLLSSLCGGGVAGLFVDVVLYPLDTIKTRLQAAQGFRKSGGFRGIYRGIAGQAIGSGPQASLFFLTYESLKILCDPYADSPYAPVMYMGSASIAEVMACLVRVPIEVIKQRRQTTHDTYSHIIANVLKEGHLGLYRGFGSTLLRDLPFSAIQFPILEFLNHQVRKHLTNNEPLKVWEYAICGAIAGGLTAAITTPVDVVKTRIMLSDKNLRVMEVFRNVYKKEGIEGLFRGVVPRVAWISVGGYIFFGSYNWSQKHFYDNVF